MEGQEFLDKIAAGEGGSVRAALTEEPTLASIRTRSGSTALQWAVYTGHASLVDVLLEFGATIDLWTACTIGRIDAIPPDADPNEFSPDGFTPLCLAVAFGHNDIVRLLLQQGANPNGRSTTLGGVAPVHSAVFGHNLDGLRTVVEAGADVNAKQEGGFTPLMGAAQNNDLEMVKYLLDHKADTGAKADDGKQAADLTSSDEIRIGLINGF